MTGHVTKKAHPCVGEFWKKSILTVEWIVQFQRRNDIALEFLEQRSVNTLQSGGERGLEKAHGIWNTKKWLTWDGFGDNTSDGDHLFFQKWSSNWEVGEWSGWMNGHLHSCSWWEREREQLLSPTKNQEMCQCFDSPENKAWDKNTGKSSILEHDSGGRNEEKGSDMEKVEEIWMCDVKIATVDNNGGSALGDLWETYRLPVRIIPMTDMPSSFRTLAPQYLNAVCWVGFCSFWTGSEMEKQRDTQMKGTSGSLRFAWNCPAWLWLKSERALWDMMKGNKIVVESIPI